MGSLTTILKSHVEGYQAQQPSRERPFYTVYPFWAVERPDDPNKDIEAAWKEVHKRK